MSSHLLAQLKNINPPGGLRPGLADYSQFIPEFVSRFLQFAIAGSGLVFLIQLIAAGYNYLTSAGDPAKVTAASKTLTHAAIGLIVIISVYSIIRVIETLLGINIV